MEQQAEPAAGSSQGAKEDTTKSMDGLSEYEMERRRKMEQNHRKLQDLGLVGPEKTVLAKPVAKRRRRAWGEAAAEAAGGGGGMGGSDAAPVAAVAVRKSLRTRNKPAPVYTENAVGFDDERERGNRRSRHLPAEQREGTAPPPPRVRIKRARVPLAPNSSRNLECDIPKLMERYLGRRFPSFGKDIVMNLSSKTGVPRFSRMPGVTQWKNALFLWVNVDDGSGYENLFDKDVSLGAGDGGQSEALNDPTAAAAVVAAKSPPTNGSLVGAEEVAVAGEVDTPGPQGPRQERTSTAREANPAAVGQHSVPPRPTLGGSGGGDGVGAAASGMKENGGDAVVGDRSTGGQSAGLSMTWFAGAHMKPESPLIQRLLLRGAPPKSDDGVVCDADANDETSPPRPEINPGEARRQHNSAESKATGLPAMTTAAVADSQARGNTDVSYSPPPATSNLQAHGNSGPNHSNTLEEGADDATLDKERRPLTDGIRSDGGEGDNTVLLFCRLPKEPYVFCGRLGYSKHWPAERPMRFIWRLLDAKRLAQWPDFSTIMASEKE